MGKSRFVKAETVRLDLTEGDWIEIKRQLRNYDRDRLRGAMIATISQDAEGDQEWTPDFARGNEMKALAWVVDWSLCDDKGKQVDFGRDAWRNLDPNTADEISEALDEYTKRLDTEAKTDPTATDSTASSPSVSGWEDGPIGTSSTPLSISQTA